MIRMTGHTRLSYGPHRIFHNTQSLASSYFPVKRMEKRGQTVCYGHLPSPAITPGMIS